MKIGISAIHVRPGKSGSHQPYLTNLVDAISELETHHEFVLFVTPANQSLFENSRKKMEFIIYPKIAEIVLPRIFFEQIWLPLDAKKRKIDVMHYPGSTASFLLRRSDVVTVHHDSVTQRKSMSLIRNLYYDVVLRFNKKAGRVIAPSQVYADELEKNFGYKPMKVWPVHHGVSQKFRSVSEGETKQAREHYGIEQDAILTVTNTNPHKNISNLLKAYDILLTQFGMKNQLVMVGYVDEEILGKIVNKTTQKPEYMHSRIKVIPFLPHEQLPPIYSAVEVFIFFSKVETFGMPLVEAMACGLPVIASDIPIHREVLKNAGILVSPEEPEILANVLYKVLVDEKYRGTLKNLAQSRSQQFSWEKTALQTVQAYEDSWSSSRNK